MKTLDQIGIEFQTDKASQFSRTYAKPHDYLRHLDRLFEPFRENVIKLLEIGVGGGESIRTWLEYFPNAKVFGVDLVSNTNDYNTPGKWISADVSPRYTFACGDQSKSEFWQKFIGVYGGDWNVIIDDGSHIDQDIVSTFSALWPHVASGGIYEIEDLQIAPLAAEWCRRVVPEVMKGHETIDSIYFSRELCVMRKK